MGSETAVLLVTLLLALLGTAATTRALYLAYRAHERAEFARIAADTYAPRRSLLPYAALTAWFVVMTWGVFGMISMMVLLLLLWGRQ